MTRICNECDTKIKFARKAGTDKYVPLEAADEEPYSPQAGGCLVVVNGEAWRPADLLEDMRVRLAISETAARELVAGHPWHRPHFHDAPAYAGAPSTTSPQETS